MKTLLSFILTLSIAYLPFAQCPSVGNQVLQSQEEVDAFCTGGSNCTVFGKLIIQQKSGETPITNLDALSCLGAVTGNLIIKKTYITDLSGLENLNTIGGSFKIVRNSLLTNLDGLGNIGNIGKHLVIQKNNSLENIEGLSGITTIDNNLVISDNPSLTSLSGLENLLSIGEELIVTYNSSLGGNGVSDCISVDEGLCTAINAGPPAIITFAVNNPACNLSAADVITSCSAALPVELVDFKVREKGIHQAELTWSTVSELNNQGFIIERSVDAVNFEEIGTVDGNGTTSERIDYRFVDTKPLAKAYYRLKQLDYDAQVEFSRIISLEMESVSPTQLVAFPTVAKNEITIKLQDFNAERAKLRIISSLGKLVYQEDINANNFAEYRTIDLSQFENGVYFISFFDGQDFAKQTFVKSNE